MKYKTITVTFDSWQKLVNIKYTMEFKNLDDVIKHLIEIKKKESQNEKHIIRN